MQPDDTHLSRAVDFLLRHRAGAATVLLLLTVSLALFASRLTFGTSPESLLETGDPGLEKLREHEAVLGGFEHALLLLLEPKDAFAPEFLRRLADATQAVSARPEVASVRSLTRTGFPLPDRSADPKGFRAAALGNPLVSPSLVSADAGAAALQVFLWPEADAGSLRARTIAAVTRCARDAGLEPRLGGIPAVRQAYADYIRADLFLLPPIVGLLLALLLGAALRRVLPVLALLGTVGLVTLWTIGLLSLAGGRVTALTAILPSLIVVVGIATGVHVVWQFGDERERGRNSRDAARFAMIRMALPCALTALTTAVGFSSLAVAGIRDVREFGLTAAAGSMLSFLLGIPVVGLALSFLPDARPVRVSRILMDGPLRALARLLLRRPGVGIGAGVVLLAVSATGFPRLNTDTFLLEDVRDGAPIREATAIVDRRLGGVIGFDLVLVAKEALPTPDVLAALGVLEPRLRELPGVRSVLGPGTLVTEAAKVAGVDPTAAAPLILAAIRARGGEDAIRAFLAPDSRLGRIAVRTGDVGSERSARIREEAFRSARALLPERVEVRVGGLTVVAETILDRLIREMAKSVLLAFAVIFLLLSGVFRSVRAGLLAMVPNVLPLVSALGFIGWAGITVRSSIALIFAVALGIAVDDTIHLMVRYRRERERGRSPRSATIRAVRRTGRPVVLTSLILLAGFLLFLVSEFRATGDFGLVASVTIVTALVGDLLVLPGLLLAGRSRRWQNPS